MKKNETKNEKGEFEDGDKRHKGDKGKWSGMIVRNTTGSIAMNNARSEG